MCPRDSAREGVHRFVAAMVQTRSRFNSAFHPHWVHRQTQDVLLVLTAFPMTHPGLPLLLPLFFIASLATARAQWPGPSSKGILLPNGWRLSPAGRHIATPDYILNLVSTPD